jgi:aromatic-amino-acid transaminase
VHIYICFSFSKTLAVYGTRVATLLILSKKSDKLYDLILENIKGKIFRNPAVGEKIVATLLSDKKLLQQYKTELSKIKLMLLKRATLFMNEADKCNLKYIKYTSGFFITIPCDNPDKIIKNMNKYNAVLRPQGKSLRVGICGITCKQIGGIAVKIKKYI